MIDTGGNHVGIELERAKNGEEILYTKGKEEELDTFKAIRRVHEVTNHKKKDSGRKKGIQKKEIKLKISYVLMWSRVLNRSG